MAVNYTECKYSFQGSCVGIGTHASYSYVEVPAIHKNLGTVGSKTQEAFRIAGHQEMWLRRTYKVKAFKMNENIKEN